MNERDGSPCFKGNRKCAHKVRAVKKLNQSDVPVEVTFGLGGRGKPL